MPFSLTVSVLSFASPSWTRAGHYIARFVTIRKRKNELLTKRAHLLVAFGRGNQVRLLGGVIDNNRRVRELNLCCLGV